MFLSAPVVYMQQRTKVVYSYVAGNLLRTVYDWINYGFVLAWSRWRSGKANRGTFATK